MALKIPPHNEDAEQSVLGAVLIDKEAISIACGILKPYDFYNETNGIIFDAMVSLYDGRKPVDVLTLTAVLKKKKVFDKIGIKYLSDLVSATPTAANIEEYALLIKEASTKRSLVHIGSTITEMGFSEENVKTILDKSESAIFSLSQGNIVRGFVPIKEALASSFDRIDELHKSGAGLRGVRTGFFDVDNLLPAETHYLLGTVCGPHPYPVMNTYFQSIVGKEVRKQMVKQDGKLPDYLIASVGGGSNAMGL